MPRPPRRWTTEALVLRHTDFGEADRILTLYTPQQGKLKALAKGVRKPTSRKGGHLDLLARVQVLLAQGREFAIVAQAEALDLYPGLHEDLNRFALAAYAAELVDRFVYEGESQPGLYRLLVETLKRLETHPVLPLVVRYYEIRLLDHVGFRPQLFSCVVCEQEIQPEPQYFSYALGGVVCPRCGPRVEGARPVRVETLKYLRHFQRSAFPQAARARPSPAAWQEMEALLQGYLTYLLERRVNAAEFLRRLREQKSGG